LRIGTKLAITSVLAILMVAGMLYLQVTGGAHVRETTAGAARQQTLAIAAAEAKASVRGMQIGLRDVLMSHSDADMQKASGYFADRVAAALKFQGEMVKLSKSAENGERITRLATLIDSYRKGEEQIAAARKQEIALEAKKGTEPSAELAKLDAEISRIRKEVTAPINVEMEALANKIVDYAKARAEESRTAAEAEAASVERMSLFAGVAVALLLIGTCVFSVFTIARPMRELRFPWELAGGNFSVFCRASPQGRTWRRRRRRREVQGRVRAEGARRGGSQMRQDKIAAEQRKADMIKLADSSKPPSARSSTRCRRRPPNSKHPPPR
jgi:hypothetical protein